MTTNTRGFTLNATDPLWDGLTHQWTDNVRSVDQVECYEIKYYFSSHPNATIDLDDWYIWYSYRPQYRPSAIPVDMLEELGTGYYYFRV